MRRPLFALLALGSLAFGLAVLVNAVDLGTDRQNRWAVIFAFAGVMFCVGVLSAGGSKDDEPAVEQASNERRARAERVVPAAPGSLRTPTMQKVPATAMAVGLDDSSRGRAGGFDDSFSVFDDRDPGPAPWRTETDEDDASAATNTTFEHTAPDNTASEDTAPDDVRLDGAATDETGSEHWLFGGSGETLDLRDAEEQPAAAARPLAAVPDTTRPDPTPPDPTPPDTTRPDPSLPVANGDDQAHRIAAALVELEGYSDQDLVATVKQSEATVIHTMMERGQLSTDGPITDQDVAMMVFLSCTTEELLDDLRSRKAHAAESPAIDRTGADARHS